MAFFVQGKDKWGGDPAVACHVLTVTVQTQSEARQVARLNRVLCDPDARARLLELAERLEAENAAALDPAVA